VQRLASALFGGIYASCTANNGKRPLHGPRTSMLQSRGIRNISDRMPDDVIYLRLAFLRALTWPRLDLGSSISNARSRYQAAIFKYLALRFASVAVLVRS
jgi:hypothetical protein